MDLRGRYMIKSIKISKTFFLVLIGTFFILVNAESAKNPLIWGKVKKQDIRLQECKFDTGASAIILGDIGRLNFQFDEPSELIRHTRVKVLTPEGKSKGNVVIRYYGGNNAQYIKNIRAQSFYINEKGKVKKNKIDSKAFYRVKINDKWNEIRFTFPDVQVGIILEYQYTLVSNHFMTHQEWTFQNEVPTLYSEFQVEIDKDLKVNPYFVSPRLKAKYKGKKKSAWVLTNLPAIHTEPYFYNTVDYIEKIKLQVAGFYQYTDSRRLYTPFIGSWSDLAKNIINAPSWSTYQSTSTFFLQGILNKCCDEKSDPEFTVRNIYHYVLENFAWNGAYSIFPQQPLNQLLDTKTGNSAEINLLLNLLLNEAGIESHPLLLSTKDNGTIFNIPLISQFNQVIVHVKTDSLELMLNATDDFRPHYLIGKRELNNRGLLLDKNDIRWIPINLEKYSIQFLYARLSYHQGRIKYKLEYAFSGYYASEHRKAVSRMESIEKYFRQYLLPLNIEATIDSFKVFNLHEIEENFKVICYLTDRNRIKENMIYFKPILFNTINDNPFNKPDRQYPVDFIYPFREISIYTFELPQHLKLVELPRSSMVRFPQDQARYRYISTLVDNQVYIRTELSFHSTFYGPENYSSLQKFFNKMIAKNEENFTLKSIQ